MVERTPASHAGGESPRNNFRMALGRWYGRAIDLEEGQALGGSSSQIVNPDNETLTRVDQATIGAAVWPSHVGRINEAVVADWLQLQPRAVDGTCTCVDECVFGQCDNMVADILCDDDNCSAIGRCDNRSRELPGLELRQGRLGYAVVTSRDIAANTIVGEYADVVTDQPTQPSEYTVQLQRTTTQGVSLFIDASTYGSLMRFVNHSCKPNCYLYEMAAKGGVAVIVYALSDIPAGREITISYGDDVWFRCHCGSDNCLSLPDN